jgi:hypothetical protein
MAVASGVAVGGMAVAPGVAVGATVGGKGVWVGGIGVAVYPLLPQPATRSDINRTRASALCRANIFLPSLPTVRIPGIVIFL